MVLGTQKRLLAALATAAAAIALAVTVTGRGCGGDSPEAAARAFVSAARAGDKHAVWELLGPATRARLEAAAQGATEKVGGTRRYAALDMLEAGDPDGSQPPVDVVLREQHGSQAIVDVLGPAGIEDTVRLVEVSGHWRVELDFD